jgi:hypothetical protein
MICSMVRAKSFGLTGASISETIKWGKKTVRVSTGGQITALTKVLG